MLARVGTEGGDGVAGSGTGQFNHPSAVAVAPSGSVFVADTANNRVVELAPDGTFLGELGQLGSGDGRLHTPTGVAVDAAGRVYVVDSVNNRVEVFDESGHYLAKWGCAGSAWASSPSRPPWPSAAKGACMWRTRTTTASIASIPPRPPGVRLRRAGRVAAPAGLGAGAASQPAAALRAC